MLDVTGHNSTLTCILANAQSMGVKFRVGFLMITSSNGNIFLRYWPFVRGTHWSPVDSSQKGQWRGALTFSLVCAWTNGWENNRDYGDFWRHRAHYEVTVISFDPFQNWKRLEFWSVCSPRSEVRSPFLWPHVSKMNTESGKAKNEMNSVQKQLNHLQLIFYSIWKQNRYLPTVDLTTIVLYLSLKSNQSISVHISWYRIKRQLFDVSFCVKPQIHRGEAMYISMINFQWNSTETKSFQ